MALLFSKTKWAIGRKKVDLEAEDLGLLLVMEDSTVPDQEDVEFLSEFTDLDEYDGANYARKTLANKAEMLILAKLFTLWRSLPSKRLIELVPLALHDLDLSPSQAKAIASKALLVEPGEGLRKPIALMHKNARICKPVIQCFHQFVVNGDGLLKEPDELTLRALVLGSTYLGRRWGKIRLNFDRPHVLQQLQHVATAMNHFI